jgi:hypothetical protein
MREDVGQDVQAVNAAETLGVDIPTSPDERSEAHQEFIDELDVSMGIKDAPADNWKHRSKGMRCSTCMWYVAKTKLEPTAPESKDFGRCRKHAPTLGGWPAMFGGDWCGDHKLDEEKLNGS